MRAIIFAIRSGLIGKALNLGFHELFQLAEWEPKIKAHAVVDMTKLTWYLSAAVVRCAFCMVESGCTESLIERHIYTSVRPYKRSHCDQKFRQQNYKNIREGREANEPHQCSFGPSKFVRTDQLDDHFARHSGEKLYTCAACKERYADRSSLPLHKTLPQ